MQPKNIIFICHGNIHRSVLAEIVCKDVLSRKNLLGEYLVTSRGLQGAFDIPRSKYENLPQYTMEWEIDEPIMGDLGVNTSLFFSKISTPVQPEDVEQAYLVIAMDYKTTNILRGYFPIYVEKILPFSSLNNDAMELEDCADRDDQSLHEIVNAEIVKAIRNCMVTFLEKYFKGK